jgi:hypothetical protein
VKNFSSLLHFSARPAPAAIGLAATLGLFASSALAQQTSVLHTPRAERSRCDHLADQLLTATGSNEALRGATQISRLQFQNGLAGIPNLTDADKQQINAAFARAFDPERFRASIRSHLALRCDAPTYSAVLSTLASPVAQRMRQFEAEAGTAAGSAALRRYFDGLNAHPPSSRRVALVDRLEASRHEVQFLENLFVLMARETAAGFGTIPPSDSDIRNSMETYVPMVKRMILLRGLGVYRDASDQDLAQYSAMWESAPFQKYNRILRQSLEVALGSGVRQAAQAVRPFLGKAPSRPNY